LNQAEQSQSAFVLLRVWGSRRVVPRGAPERRGRCASKVVEWGGGGGPPGGGRWWVGYLGHAHARLLPLESSGKARWRCRFTRPTRVCLTVETPEVEDEEALQEVYF
jgi:hypothetical protein